jgi:hypothetical protein
MGRNVSQQLLLAAALLFPCRRAAVAGQRLAEFLPLSGIGAGHAGSRRGSRGVVVQWRRLLLAPVPVVG